MKNGLARINPAASLHRGSAVRRWHVWHFAVVVVSYPGAFID